MNARAVVVAVLVALVVAGAAQARVMPGDPRICTSGSTEGRRAECANGTAVLELRRVMSARIGVGGIVWDAPIECAAVGSLLRFRCTWHSNATTGIAAVNFAHKRAGWVSAVTVSKFVAGQFCIDNPDKIGCPKP